MPKNDELIEINKKLLKANEKQAQQLAILQQQVEYLKRQLYGRKSEKGIEHLDLFEEEDVPGKSQKLPKRQ